MLAIRPNEGLCHLFFKIANIHKKIYTAVRWLLNFYKRAEVGNKGLREGLGFLDFLAWLA